MARRDPRVLCHDDGSLFCVWSPGTNAYAIYITDEITPPDPASLKIETRKGLSGLSATVWRRVRMQAAPLVEFQQAIGPYDDESGEFIE